MGTGTLLAISAGVTFLLAVAAFWAIWQNHQLQKKERRERLLNEIIEWAIDISDFLQGWNVGQLVWMSDEYTKKAAYISDWLTSVNNLTSRSISISKIAEPFGTSLHMAVKNVVNDLYDHNKLFNEWCNDKVNPEAVISQKSLFGKSVFGKSVNELIEEATKLKTKDIT